MTTRMNHNMIAKQADKINDLHSSLGGLAKKSLQVAQEIGERLSRIKAELKHGEWLPWCRENLAFGINTAGNYMRLHRERDKFTSIGNLDLTEAYRLLSALVDATRRTWGGNQHRQSRFHSLRVKPEFRGRR